MPLPRVLGGRYSTLPESVKAQVKVSRATFGEVPPLPSRTPRTGPCALKSSTSRLCADLSVCSVASLPTYLLFEADTPTAAMPDTVDKALGRDAQCHILRSRLRDEYS